MTIKEVSKITGISIDNLRYVDMFTQVGYPM